MDNNSTPQFKLPLIMAAVLIGGFVLGFTTNNLIIKQKPLKEHTTQTKTEPTIEMSKLPIDVSILTNPMVYEWRGTIRGKLTTKKDENTFTLVDDKGHSITITSMIPKRGRWDTRFIKKITNPQGSPSAKIVTLKDIPLGSSLVGDFWIFRDHPDIPIGSILNIE